MPEKTIARLRARHEIGDLVKLGALSFDVRRWHFWDRICAPEATVAYGAGAAPVAWQKWRATAQAGIRVFARTQHHVGNLLVDVDVGNGTAVSEAYILAAHLIVPEAPRAGFWGSRAHPFEAIATGRYVDRWRQLNGEWRMVARRAYVEWRYDRPVREGAPPIPLLDDRAAIDAIEARTFAPLSGA